PQRRNVFFEQTEKSARLLVAAGQVFQQPNRTHRVRLNPANALRIGEDYFDAAAANVHEHPRVGAKIDSAANREMDQARLLGAAAPVMTCSFRPVSARTRSMNSSPFAASRTALVATARKSRPAMESKRARKPRNASTAAPIVCSLSRPVKKTSWPSRTGRR